MFWRWPEELASTIGGPFLAGGLFPAGLNCFPVAGTWLPPAGQEAKGLQITPLCSRVISLQGLGQNPLTSCQIVITHS